MLEDDPEAPLRRVPLTRMLSEVQQIAMRLTMFTANRDVASRVAALCPVMLATLVWTSTGWWLSRFGPERAIQKPHNCSLVSFEWSRVSGTLGGDGIGKRESPQIVTGRHKPSRDVRQIKVRNGLGRPRGCRGWTLLEGTRVCGVMP